MTNDVTAKSRATPASNDAMVTGDVNDASNEEEARLYVDRVQAIAWREARDAGATFITRKWVAKKLGRSPGWVASYWNKELGKICNDERNSEASFSEVASTEIDDITLVCSFFVSPVAKYVFYDSLL